jgi:hypothetical protein
MGRDYRINAAVVDIRGVVRLITITVRVKDVRSRYYS